jgi:hypothetical protein
MARYTSRMINGEALEAFGRKEKLDQPTIRRLLDEGLIKAANVTNMQTPPGEEEFLPTGLTTKGRRLLEKQRNQRQRDAKEPNGYARLRQRIPRIELKAALTIFCALLGTFFTYKYSGAEDLRNKVYRPLSSDLEKMERSVRGNSTTSFFSGQAFTDLRQSGDFNRMPKSLQRELDALYQDEGQLQSNVAPVTELLERQSSAKIERIRSAMSDQGWAQQASSHIRAEELQKPGTSSISSSTITHSSRGRGVDIRDPNHPIVSSPGGPTLDINDWLTYPESLKTIESLWSQDDYLYFDDSQDMWYYRITRYDLGQQHLTLKEFLEPIHNVLWNDTHFKYIQNQQPSVLRRLIALRTKIAERMDDPKKITDVFD